MAEIIIASHEKDYSCVINANRCTTAIRSVPYQNISCFIRIWLGLDHPTPALLYKAILADVYDVSLPAIILVHQPTTHNETNEPTNCKSMKRMNIVVIVNLLFHFVKIMRPTIHHNSSERWCYIMNDACILFCVGCTFMTDHE